MDFKILLFLLGSVLCASAQLNNPAYVASLSKPVAAAGGGSLTITSLTSGSDTTSNPSSTASVSPTGGSVQYMVIAVAQTSAPGTWGSVGVTGGTWTQLSVRHDSGNRRGIFLLRATDASGVQTITYTEDSGTWTESAWCIFEATGHDATTPNDTPVTAGSATSVTSLATASVGTPGTGDRVVGTFWHENDEAVTFTGFTSLAALTGLTDIRTLNVGYDAADPQDDTPEASWSTGSSAGGIGWIINVAP